MRLRQEHMKTETGLSKDFESPKENLLNLYYSRN